MPHPDRDDRTHSRPPPGLSLDPELPELDHPPEIPQDRLDQDALKVIVRLRHMRHQAYLVGGCVRDLLLHKTPKDFDVATDAHPGEVRAIFRNCRLIGRRFRLAHVYFRGGKVIEVATFRKNPVDVGDDVPEGSDLLITRDNVFGTAEEDAVRRDFTVNGLFYDVLTGEVIDYVGGRQDLEDHRISTIGDPEIRMREDPVRALRAIRFAARLGFTIAPDTFAAMRRHAGELARCAPARVLEEIFKILRCGGSARAFELMRACGALAVILPALGAAFDGWDDAKRRAFFAHLAALDRKVRAGEDLSEAVLLGTLLVHLPVDETGDRPEADALMTSLVATSRLPRKIAERIRLALVALRAQKSPEKGGGRRRRRGRGGPGAVQDDAIPLLEITVEATGEGKELLERWKSAPRKHHADRDQDQDEPARDEPRRAREPRQRTVEIDATRAEPDDDEAEDDADEADDVEAASPDPSVPSVGPQSGPETRDAAAGDAPRKKRRRRGGRRRRRRGAGAAPSGGGAAST
ncbi:MAG: polynucleotide adenylyltransferase PcnB [Anaeromyxobacteraceae bacterium]